VLTVLPLELAVEAGMMRWTLEYDDAEPLEHLEDLAGRVLAGSVAPPDERCPVLDEVALDGPGDTRTVVALDAGNARPERHGRVGGDQEVTTVPRGLDVHGVEAPDDTGLGDEHTLRPFKALSLDGGQRFPFDAERLASRDSRYGFSERVRADEPAQGPHLRLDLGDDNR